MRYDRDVRRRSPHSRADFLGRDEYGEGYEVPYPRRGWSEGFLGGDLRSRGSWTASPAGEFEWGGGYIGGRGYGGTNYDIEHGYATRGGYAWGEAELSEEYGPARYGYGPYYDRLRRRRRSDDDLRQEVEETLFYDTWVDADAISVSVEDGVVTLRGTLPSYDELRYAVDDTWDVDGVRGVRSELQVNENPGRGTGTGRGRYEPGAPHMHGHPHAGEAGASTGASTRTGRDTDRSGRRGGGRSARVRGDTSAPPTGKGMAASGGRSAGGARGERAGGRRGRSGGTSASGEARRGRVEVGGGAAGGTAEGGTAQGQGAVGPGESGTDLSHS